MHDLRNKVIWITGASSGIGEALAYALAKRGSILALSARRSDTLEKVRAQIALQGGQAEVFVCDVTDLPKMKQSASDIVTKFGRIDILISNAGDHLPSDPVNFNSSEYMRIMNVNYGGMLHAIESALPHMLKQSSGYIAAVASLAGYRGLPIGTAYGASKAAMISFLESLRFHLKASSIPVSIINPGFVKTALTDLNHFYMPFMISPEKAANIMVRGLELGKPEITFPFPFNFILKLGRILPYWLYQLIVEKLWSRIQKS